MRFQNTFRAASFSSAAAIKKNPKDDALAAKIIKYQLKNLLDPLAKISNLTTGFGLFVQRKYQSVAAGSADKKPTDCIKELALIWKSDKNVQNEFQEKAKLQNEASIRSNLAIFSDFSVYEHIILGRRLFLMKKLGLRKPSRLPELIFKKKRSSGLIEFMKAHLGAPADDLALLLGVGVGNVGSMSAVEKLKAVSAKYTGLSDAEKQEYKDKAAAQSAEFDKVFAGQDKNMVEKANAYIAYIRQEALDTFQSKEKLAAKKEKTAAMKRATALKKKESAAKKKAAVKAKKDAIKAKKAVVEAKKDTVKAKKDAVKAKKAVIKAKKTKIVVKPKKSAR